VSGLSSTLEALINLLADGGWHSGEDLGAALGISRAAVSKQLKQLSSIGLEVERVQGTGYRLASPLDLYSREGIFSRIPASLVKNVAELHLFSVVESTNTFFMDKLSNGERIHAELCLAEQQRSGRGRRGREWHSPFAQNIYFSVAWHFDGGVSAIEGLSLAVGVAVSRALETLGVTGVELKGPNDLLVNDKKLGGILIELGGDAVSDCVAVIGVGLNVHMQHDQSDALDQPWTSLADLGAKVTKNAVAAAFITELLPLLETYQDRRFLSYLDAWNRRCAYKGSQVRLLAADHHVDGDLIGVDQSGALLLKLSGGQEKAFVGGELSMRKRS